MNPALEALSRLHLGTVPTQDEVWNSVSPYHVESLHPDVSRRLLAAMKEVSDDRAPSAAVIQGEAGAGKTHLLSWTREEIQNRGGFFFYIKLVNGHDFWRSATGSLVDSLYRKDEGGQEQLLHLLRELSRAAGLDDATCAAVTGERDVTSADLDTFVGGIRRLDRQVGNEARDTARALVLVAAARDDAVAAGTSYFALNDDELGQRAVWGLPSTATPAQRVLRDLTRLFALVGPLVFAFDQLDNLVAVSESSALTTPSSGERRAARRLSGDIADGLMDLREETRRTLMVVACQPDTWHKISQAAMGSALDRFDLLPELGAIPDEATAAAIVASRLRATYESTGFSPPYPTFPITAAALAQAPRRYTVRRLLQRMAQHVKACLDAGHVIELTTLSETETATATVSSASAVEDRAEDEALTERFEVLRSEADPETPLDKATEDRLMPGLLGAGLKCLMIEFSVDDSRFAIEAGFGRRAALHAQLRMVLDEATENDVRWSFRGVATGNALSAQSQMRNAMTEAGLEAGVVNRQLSLLRNTRYPSGPKTEEIKADFETRGGRSVPISGADLRTMAALRRMFDEDLPGIRGWLRRTRPASRTEVFSSLVTQLRQYVGDASGTTTPPEPPEQRVPQQVADSASPITFGTSRRGGRHFAASLDKLRMHTVVIGAAGSGKTVLLKRLAEQCALRGVSSIVLDPNDDLARLGDPWPTPPPEWHEGQAAEAERYFSGTEVVVWTPGLNRGRPLFFNPLPDFGPVLDDEDDLRGLLTSTVNTLAPHVGIHGASARATQQRGVLRRALSHYAREGGRSLRGLVDLLAEPPSDMVNARTRKLADSMADTLEAALDTDPLLDESGRSVDPGVLLTPSPGKRARISVVSFDGLSGDAPAQFVTRLQAALFSWFKAHPAADGTLGGLLILDEAQDFVPSGASNPSTESTVDLIRQVRKYGLGIVLASQAPKGIHNQALGNTANQFIGRVTAAVQVEAVKAMATARNSAIGEPGSLSRGSFYAAGEGTPYVRIDVPLCLSHHVGPLTEDEVVEHARRA
ncbi:AAA family ATPase [Amycolatopsis rhabdoformis]|uniref:AAA family ATPase n=1 Tax=Amycolatopsis rhabdoformis TaxID=1448059 RepID=A0ABZ1IH99_9PSEU|nr:AAA family ATPase [Amycolatopsis rhabdoformis]WSE33033.1 AAA family ATPase [Amycolatopsis rhabdoformis]